ncbi:unnamed protein product [Lactuca virosa]|uniref:Uncharacterized protein n=1 Tax=Lactuca virosa TaxID=75947 RepID=A0AAU9MLQ3_9ASTR|nr:unnamed protein product [Lactuca virosa]
MVVARLFFTTENDNPSHNEFPFSSVRDRSASTHLNTFFRDPFWLSPSPISLHIGIKMKFFNWMQSKFNGGQEHKNSHTATSTTLHVKQDSQKEEFNDWPHGLLAIGTFGNNDIPTENEEIEDNKEVTASSSPDLSDFTPEEIGKLQKELTKLLSKKPAANKQGEISADLPLDRFLNCPSSLEVDRRLSTTVITNQDDKEEDIDRTIRVILGSSGLPPMPSLQDRLPESRMERLLRAMLKNKINPQNSSRASSTRKLIENRQSPRKGKGKAIEKQEEDANDGSKWVKTDSEYIVLEI